MNTRHKHEASSLKITIFKVMPEGKQQLVEEKDADNISTLQIIHSVVLRIKSAKSPVLIRSSCVAVEVKF